MVINHFPFFQLFSLPAVPLYFIVMNDMLQSHIFTYRGTYQTGFTCKFHLQMYRRVCRLGEQAPSLKGGLTNTMTIKLEWTTHEFHWLTWCKFPRNNYRGNSFLPFNNLFNLTTDGMGLCYGKGPIKRAIIIL